MGASGEGPPCAERLASVAVGMAMPEILAAICEEQGWAWAASWLVDRDAAAMRAEATWSSPAMQLGHLEALVRGDAVAHGIGLAGRTWASGQPAWAPDVAVDDDRPLALAARDAGLRAGFAFPIRLEDEVVGILEFFSAHVRMLDEALVTRMDAVGEQIGRILRREDAVRHPEVRRAAPRARSEAEAEAEARRLAFLGNARALLASSIDYDSAVGLVPRLAASGLADWCVLEILNAEGWVERVAVAYADDDGEATVSPLAAGAAVPPGGVDHALLVDEADQAALTAAFPRREQLQLVRSVGTPWLMRIPLSARGRLLGILTLLTTRAGRSFDAIDLSLAQELALIGAVSIDNARLRRESEEALRRNDNLLFLSHDLNHPLGVIDLNTSLLEEILRDGGELEVDELARGLGRIRRASVRMGALIREVLDLARTQAGEPVALERSSTDLVPLVRQLVEELQRDCSGRRIEIDVAAPELIGLLDRNRIERAISNLLSNAIKYSRGAVRVAVRRDAPSDDRSGDWAVIEVADSGIGIPEAFFPYLFRPFHRAANVDGVSGGAGIGLASAHQAVSLHKGTISVRSTEGEGSVFTVRLPLWT